MSKPPLDVPAGGRVLEIGSGHDPHPRADVLCDLHLEDRERAGPLKRDRPLVLASGEALPFEDDSFDYVVAIHVAEHADDIERFFAELRRVAPAGYLETPSMIGERLFGWRKHRWMLWKRDGVVWVRRREEGRPFGALFHELMRRDPQMGALYYRYPELFRVRLRWEGRIDYRILGPGDPDPVDLDDPEVLADLLASRAPAWRWLRAYLSGAVRGPLWRLWRDCRARWRR